MAKERFKLDFDNKCIVDELNGLKYSFDGGHNSVKHLCKLLNRESNLADRNEELILNKDSFNNYQLWWHLSELCEDIKDKIEQNIKRYIDKNWHSDLDAYVEVHPYGCIEITVFGKTLDFKEFEKLIISELLEIYTLNINGFETYMTDEDKYCYYEWHLGNGEKMDEFIGFETLN